MNRLYVTVFDKSIFFFVFFSHDGKYITAGSENQCVFLWRTHYEPNNLSVSRKDRNDHYEAIKGKKNFTMYLDSGVLVFIFDNI